MTKSKAKKYGFKGKLSYAKLVVPDEYKGVKKWKVCLHPDPKDIPKIQATGISTHLKDENEASSGVAGKFFQFNRPTTIMVQGTETPLDPPRLLDTEGEEFEFEEGIGIGNGTTATVLVTVYDTKSFGKGCRIDAVKIHDLVEYEFGTDYEDIGGDDDDDEIPF